MVKVVAKYGEESKVAIRNIRRDVKKTIDKYQKDGLSEDLCKDKEGDLQNLTDDYVKKIESSVKDKEKEVTQVQFKLYIYRERERERESFGTTQHPQLHDLLTQFYDKTGCPMLLNTSLNIKGMPIVNDKQDAFNFTEKRSNRF